MNILPKLFLLAALCCASSPALLANQVYSVIVPSAQVPAGQTATLTASVGYMGVQRSGQITFLVTRPNGTSSYHYANSPSGQISVVYAPNAGGIYTVKAKIDGMYQESYYNPQWYSFNPAWSPIASFSAAAGDTTPPDAPALPTATNITDTSFRVNWTKPNDNVGVTFYYVYVTYADGTPRYNLSTESTASALSMDIPDLIQGTTYKVRIRARDAAQNTSSDSPEMAQQTIDTENPSAPAAPGVVANSVTPTSIGLSWSRPADNVGVKGYQVERLNPDGSTYLYPAFDSEASSVAFTLTGLTQGNAYRARVKAKDGRSPAPNWSGWSGYSAAQLAPQALSVNRSATQAYGTSQTLGASGGAGGGAVTYAIVGHSASDVATLSGSTLTANASSGWVDVQATKAADGNYSSATSAAARK